MNKESGFGLLERVCRIVVNDTLKQKQIVDFPFTTIEAGQAAYNLGTAKMHDEPGRYKWSLEMWKNERWITMLDKFTSQL